MWFVQNCTFKWSRGIVHLCDFPFNGDCKTERYHFERIYSVDNTIKSKYKLTKNNVMTVWVQIFGLSSYRSM